MFRIGTGFDVHKLVENRKLVMCGVEIPYKLGLLGHSDADVALHALMDAMLGALALGDIGAHFPDNDGKFKDISSLILLRETAKLIDQKNYRLANADITIIAQRPKFRPYIEEMRRNIANTINIQLEQISVKATTTEELGFAGRGEGIAAEAVVLLQKKMDEF